MNRIRKIKSYFTAHGFYSWKDFDLERYALTFRSIDEEMLLDIGNYIKSNLNESEQVGNKRHRLKPDIGSPCKNLDELLPLLKTIIDSDYRQTSMESEKYRWDFSYFVGEHTQCENTICISNMLRATDMDKGNCIYPLASIRKYQNTYYCWSHD